MKTIDFDYHLPTERIAQRPIEPRDHARLMLVNRETGEQKLCQFKDLLQFLRPNDLLVVNRTRVIPARLQLRKIPDGGKAEILLLERIAKDKWKCIVGGKNLDVGKKLMLPNKDEIEIIEKLNGSQRIVQFQDGGESMIAAFGEVPLPPYIDEHIEDKERYQTVYASEEGSSAAPTAGLHFTPQLIKDIRKSGISFAEITLHIGLDTFAPVSKTNPLDHKIHSEWCDLSPEVAQQIINCKSAGGRIIAVGTTSVRTLESAAKSTSSNRLISEFQGRTELFILPGFKFQIVDAMITNFHLPKSTLIMMVSAFAGRDAIMDSYQLAINEKFRFYSFGDAMFIN